MISRILCVFEGAKREHQYFSSLQNHLFDEQSVIKCSFENDIFELYKDISDDPDLDIVELVRESEIVPKNRKVLENLSRDDIAQVYLFFDMEPHDNAFLAEHLQYMIETFCEETENGKLFVSYPMLEALRDISAFETYNQQMIPVRDCGTYKHISTNRCLPVLKHVKKFDLSMWKKLIVANVRKASFIVHGDNNVDVCPEQIDIFSVQIDILQAEKQIYVLSAFPLFCFHHFGHAVILMK